MPGRGDPDETSLLERAEELAALDAAVANLARGDGGVVVITAAAGLGKTSLLEAAIRQAGRVGALVRRAAPGPLERHFPFGAVRTLLERPLRDAPADERARLGGGPAAPAARLLLDGATPGDADPTAVAHSVLWLCSALAHDRPLALCVDDAQWCDRASLEVLCYLARRADELPLLVAVAARGDDPDAATDLVSLLGAARGAHVLRPQPLGLAGAARLVRRIAPAAPFEACRACHRSAGGNPWLLGELGRQIAVHGSESVSRPADGQPPVSDVARDLVRRRLAALRERDRAVARVLAIVGADAPPTVIARVAGVPPDDLATARDALAAAGLLDPGGERFAHALIAAAIADGVPGGERERLHRDAARALAAAGAAPDVVAGHLLRCNPRGDPAVSALLDGAAAAAAAQGAPHTAAAYLDRALAERAPGAERGRMLAERATLGFEAGLPDARGRLREALREEIDPGTRLDVLTRLAALATVDAGDAELAALLERELAETRDAAVRLAVDAARLDALLMIPERHRERAELAAHALSTAPDEPLLRCVVLAHQAWLATERGSPDARGCALLAREALAGDLLLGEAWRRSAYHLCARALVASDQVDDARTAIAALRDQAEQRGSLRQRASASWLEAYLALRCGDLAHAEDASRLTLDLLGADADIFTGGALEILVTALAARGATREAHDLLRGAGLDGERGMRPWAIGVRHARALVRLADGDYAGAHADACAVGARREAQGRRNPTWTPWRSTAALALAHIGRRDGAVALADAELALAERFGAPVPVVGALHARAVAEPDAGAREALCRRALAVAAGTPARLDAIRVRLVLGRTLAHEGRRLEAREVLLPALADADAAGAVPLADEARRHLVATGLRPRRAALTGAAALTPRQRQVGDLAAAGRSNRAIAHELFLSVKTVETHLAAVYEKLGVTTRAELPAALGHPPARR
ncbi:MAG TPA: LuxR family transcriptional regulator [Acidimicrobiales bacterium]|nr:LuxR family transcriptional regulator [Acidimicrobiales bacterium]